MNHSRRSFFASITGAAAGLTYLRTAVAKTHELAPLLASAAPGSENYWKLVSEQFPMRPGKIAMNAANLCPSPRAVSDRVTELTRDEDSDVSFQNRGKFHELLEESRKKVAEQVGASPEEIALVRNTSEANNLVNNGYPLKAGDEVVLFDQNHPTNNVAWDVRAARFGFSVKRVAVPMTVKDNAEIVKLFEAALTPQTKVLSVTYVSNTTGIRLPGKELAALAHSRGIYFHLDGAQAWGFLHLDLHDIGCDSFSSSAHKWFMGPKEAGLLYVKSDRIAQIWPNTVAPGWGEKVETMAKGARKFETLGQRDDACLSAVGTGVDFHRVLGFDRIEPRTMELAQALKEGLARINGVKVVTPMDPKLSSGVTVSAFPAMDRKKVSALANDLYVKYGVGGAGMGEHLRLCPHVYNTMDDVEQTVRGVRELMAS